MRQEKVLERVYHPGRLQAAWQQVKENAGAAGIDRMTVAEFERRAEELLTLIHEKLKAGSYRFKPATKSLNPKRGRLEDAEACYPGSHGSSRGPEHQPGIRGDIRS